jgi:hypothetical protein
MNPTVVGDDVRRHREGACVPRVGEDIDSDARERAMRRDEPVVHAMHPSNDLTDAAQFESRYWGTGEHARPRAGGDKRTHRDRRKPYVGVQVDPRKRTGHGIAERDRVGLSGRLGFDDPHAGRSRDLRRAVVACIGDHDDVELVRLSRLQKGPEICPNDGFLVVRRNDDTDRRSRRMGRPRRAAHADLHAAPLMRATVGAPPDTVSAGTATERSDLRSLSSMNSPTIRPRPRIHDRLFAVTGEREGAA